MHLEGSLQPHRDFTLLGGDFTLQNIGTMSDDYNSDNDSLFSLEDAFDCDALCVVMQEVDEEEQYWWESHEGSRATYRWCW